MNIFWDNILKFPRFFISVLMGFFLTTFNPFFELLRHKKNRFIYILSISFFIIAFSRILKLMLALN
uniref:Uncharacterized protein ycf33 n=1 Tax=Synarthrophyton chejuense TaxID=2485825 RepID=A0A3G3MFV1_9FLOR|nr:hypothetical protein [Synarthrophyton chejuense]AYR05696.1 hypothetical protein [Synarthrophyton chejuense]